MEKGDFNWTQISIFYNRENFHQLINDCIGPFVNLMQEKKYLTQYFLHFSEEQGEHIRFSVKSPRSTSKRLLQKWNNEMKKYLSLFPSLTLSQELPSHNFFINFPNNTVEYNIYLPYPKATRLLNEIELEETRSYISEAIINVLSKEQINEESLFTFCYYMQVAIIKSAFRSKNLILSDLEMISQPLLYGYKLDTNQQAAINRQVSSLFTSNREILKELFDDVWEDGDKNTEMVWINAWENTCEKMVLSGKQVQPLFVDLTCILFEHLGVSNPLKRIVSTNLIFKTLDSLKLCH